MVSPSLRRAWPENWLHLNAVCPYYTMFPLDFPLAQLSASPDARRVLDPFCGRGTTLYAARLMGVASVGIDINPVAAAIASAKLVKTTPKDVNRLAQNMIAESGSAEVPEGEFWSWGYHAETLRDIAALRAGLMTAEQTSAAVMLRALLLGILHGPVNKGLPSYLSNQMPRTYASKPGYAIRYWQSRRMSPVQVDTLAVVSRRAERLLGNPAPAARGKVLLNDAVDGLRSLRERFDLVVTSPPYYGMRTYVSDQWLRSWFLGGPAEPEYDSTGQLARQPNQAAFVTALARVWEATAARCRQGSRLAVRFGALPSASTDPKKLLLTSLDEAACGWTVEDVRAIEAPSRQRRQAEQFGRAGQAITEIDVTARLGKSVT